jgi:hypothetical protein
MERSEGEGMMGYASTGQGGHMTARAGLITTASGRILDLFDPQPDQICIEDIAHGLAYTCRFAGQLAEFLSVAQHSVVVALLLSHGQRFHGLLHDAAEAYIGDVSKPLKLMPEMAGYVQIERRLQRAIANKFGVPEHKTPEVERADRLAQANEASLWKQPAPFWARRLTHVEAPTVPLNLLHQVVPPSVAESIFLKSFRIFAEEAAA